MIVQEYKLSDDFWTTVYAKCPVCTGPSKLRCKCRLADSECAQGHHWHHHSSKDKHIVVQCASPHAKDDDTAPDCPLCKHENKKRKRDDDEEEDDDDAFDVIRKQQNKLVEQGAQRIQAIVWAFRLHASTVADNHHDLAALAETLDDIVMPLERFSKTLLGEIPRVFEECKKRKKQDKTV